MKVIIRTTKLKTIGNLAASGKHTFRERETPNADPARTPSNSTVGAKSAAELVDKVKARLPEKRRKDAVIAIEYLISASPEFFGGPEWFGKNHGSTYFKKAIEWLREKHGRENVVCANLQVDESTPHLVVYVVPMTAAGKLSAKEFLGGREKLTKMQTDFAKKVGAPFGLERGIEGSRAKHQTIKKYYADAQAPVGQRFGHNWIETLENQARESKRLAKENKRLKKENEELEKEVADLAPLAKLFSPGEIKAKRAMAAFQEQQAAIRQAMNQDRPGEAPDAPRGPKL
jgi:hypothetical protein